MCTSHATIATITTTHAFSHATETATITMTQTHANQSRDRDHHDTITTTHRLSLTIQHQLLGNHTTTALQTSTLREIGHNNHNHPIIIIIE
jgi:hypothetical protein